MNVHFHTKEGGPERLLAEAEVHLEGDLEGMKLVGFSLWRRADGDVLVTVPARAFGMGSDRRYFDLLRSVDGNGKAVKAVKDRIIQAYRKHQAEV